MEFKDLIVTSLLTGLFIFAIISGSIYLTSSNNVNNSLMKNQAFNNTFGELQTELKSEQSIAQSQKAGLEIETPTVGTDSFLFSSIISSGKVFTGMWRNIYDLTFGLISKTTGISPVVIGVIVSILLILIVLMAWSLYKQGR